MILSSYDATTSVNSRKYETDFPKNGYIYAANHQTTALIARQNNAPRARSSRNCGSLLIHRTASTRNPSTPEIKPKSQNALHFLAHRRIVPIQDRAALSRTYVNNIAAAIHSTATEPPKILNQLFGGEPSARASRRVNFYRYRATIAIPKTTDADRLV